MTKIKFNFEENLNVFKSIEGQADGWYISPAKTLVFKYGNMVARFQPNGVSHIRSDDLFEDFIPLRNDAVTINVNVPADKFY